MGLKHRVSRLFNNNDYREILNKGFSFFVLRIGGLFAGYVFTYFIAKEFGASELGLISLCFTVIMCVSIFGRLGIDVNLIPHFSNDKNKDDSGLFFKVLFKAFIASSLLGFIVFLLKDVISIQLFNKPQLESYIFWTALTIPFWTIVLVCAGLFRSFKINSYFAFFNNPGRFLASLLVLLVFLKCCKDTPLLAIKAHFFGVFIIAIICIVLAIKQFNLRHFKLNSESSNSWKFLIEAFPMMLSGVVIVFLGWIDTIVLGIYETDSTIGVYNVTLKIATLTSFSLQAINSILAPKIARFYGESDILALKKVITFATNTNFVITILIIVLIMLFHNLILGLFGDEFLSGTTLLFLLCVSQLINSLSGSVGLIMQMTGLQKVYQNIVLVALLINITLNFMLIPKYGTVGAAIATIISMAFWNIYGATYLKRKKNIISYFNWKSTKT